MSETNNTHHSSNVALDRPDPAQMKIFANMPIERKWALVSSMQRMAREICRRGIQSRNPELTEQELDREVAKVWSGVTS